MVRRSQGLASRLGTRILRKHAKIKMIRMLHTVVLIICQVVFDPSIETHTTRARCVPVPPCPLGYHCAGLTASMLAGKTAAYVMGMYLGKARL